MPRRHATGKFIGTRYFPATLWWSRLGLSRQLPIYPSQKWDLCLVSHQPLSDSARAYIYFMSRYQPTYHSSLAIDHFHRYNYYKLEISFYVFDYYHLLESYQDSLLRKSESSDDFHGSSKFNCFVFFRFYTRPWLVISVPSFSNLMLFVDFGLASPSLFWELNAVGAPPNLFPNDNSSSLLGVGLPSISVHTGIRYTATAIWYPVPYRRSSEAGLWRCGCRYAYANGQWPPVASSRIYKRCQNLIS